MRVLSVIAIVFFFVSCSSPQENSIEKTVDEVQQDSVVQDVREEFSKKRELPDSVLVKELAMEIISLLKSRQLKNFSHFIHPQKGLQFSPSATLSHENILVTSNDYDNFYAREELHVFGYHAGSGEEIKMSFKQYYQSFIYNVDYANAPQISYNHFLGAGNSLNNLKEVYPDAHFVEYYFSSFDKKYEGMDWQTLRLVFEKYENQFYLVAIVHDQWTI
jgi:hypothetical protein